MHVDTTGPVNPDVQQIANAFWVLDAMTMDNGATRIVPGSHRKFAIPKGNYTQANGTHPDEIYISASPGELLLLSAHLWHSGSKNKSGARRRVIIAQFERTK
ncbi:MAG: phytanoyl-CoA dioxygenase family protein [Pseudomonadales bacterium]|nr:phytanoyl-CoA dioxygenase family protein [Pseudomonadales bacterium]